MGKFLELDDVRRLDLNLLVRLLPGRGNWNFFRLRTRGKYIRAILDSWPEMERRGINTPVRVAHFLGQGLIETRWLEATEENLKYSEAALLRSFSVYKRNPQLAKKHAYKDRLIANTAYGTGKLAENLGNTEEGDGWRFRGRGFFQLTGRYNYTKYGDIAGIPLDRDPDLLSSDLRASVAVAAAYWDEHDLSWPADRGHFRAVSRGVNRGNTEASLPAHGEDERVLWTQKVLELLGEPAQYIVGSGRDLDIGSTGDDVRELQENLTFLGYDMIGPVDGIFGNKTRAAVLAFQDMAGLKVTGVADPETVEVVEEHVENSRGQSEASQSTPARIRFRPFEQGA